jgi:membrane-bound metal-dependent hydrolase YbcI (DUF457 family)
VTDVLTHVLVAYVLGAGAAEAGRLPERFVPVVMVGATAPDGMKLFVLLDIAVGTARGVPYSAWGLHTVGGVLALSGIGALTVWRGDRAVAFGALLAGGVSHLLLDVLVVRVDGVAPPYLFPVGGWLPPTPGLYASSDAWPLAVALCCAVPVWLYRRTDESGA